MSKRTTIITLGIFVALMPFLGFPGVAKTIFFVIVGLTLVVIGYLLGTECGKCNTEEKNIDTQNEIEEKKASSSINNSVINDNT